jgi:hypothetical protein
MTRSSYRALYCQLEHGGSSSEFTAWSSHEAHQSLRHQGDEKDQATPLFELQGSEFSNSMAQPICMSLEV